jgi:SAM-dependent methyltransferase
VADDTSPALSFGPAADLYDEIRPTYPPAALEWALGPATNIPAPGASRGEPERSPRRVVDLGAGTGILTRVALGLGYEVVPVEPDAAMRARLARTTPGARPLAGSAEAIPVPDGQLDGVIAGQSYHWFDPERAHREIARVLKPGGVFAPIWNIRDESVPWLAELTRIADGVHGQDSGVHDDGLRDRDFGSQFGPVERELFRHEVSMTAESLVKLMASRSYYLTATPEKQARIEADIRALAAGLPETFPLPYVTVVYRSVRL